MTAEGLMQVGLMAALSCVRFYASGTEISDIETVAYAEVDMWLGPTEIVENVSQKEFAFVVFCELKDNSSDNDIREAVDASEAEDRVRILSHILSSPVPSQLYLEFKKWAEELGDIAVANSKYAWTSFAFGVDSLFANSPKVCFTKAIVGTGVPVTMDVVVVVSEGDVPHPVSSAKVAKMFKASVDITGRFAIDDCVKLHVVDNTKSVATPVEFIVTFGDVAMEKIFLRLSE